MVFTSHCADEHGNLMGIAGEWRSYFGLDIGSDFSGMPMAPLEQELDGCS